MRYPSDAFINWCVHLRTIEEKKPKRNAVLCSARINILSWQLRPWLHWATAQEAVDPMELSVRRVLSRVNMWRHHRSMCNTSDCRPKASNTILPLCEACQSHPWHGCSILTLILSNPKVFPLKWTSSASKSWRFNFSPSRDCCELDAALKNNHLESPGNSIFIRTTTNHGARLNTAQAMRICKTTIDVRIAGMPVLSWRFAFSQHCRHFGGTKQKSTLTN